MATTRMQPHGRRRSAVHQAAHDSGVVCRFSCLGDEIERHFILAHMGRTPVAWWLTRQLCQQRLGLLQVSRVKALREPAVERSE